MPGNFDNIIREVLNSTQAKPVGDVVPFPDLPKIMQDDAPIAPDEQLRKSLFLKSGPLHRNMLSPYIVRPTGPAANDASIASAILRG